MIYLFCMLFFVLLVSYKERLTSPGSWRFTPCFPPRCLECQLLQWPIWGQCFSMVYARVQLHSFAPGYPVFLTPLVDKTTHSPWCVLAPLLKIHLSPGNCRLLLPDSQPGPAQVLLSSWQDPPSQHHPGPYLTPSLQLHGRRLCTGVPAPGSGFSRRHSQMEANWRLDPEGQTQDPLAVVCHVK